MAHGSTTFRASGLASAVLVTLLTVPAAGAAQAPETTPPAAPEPSEPATPSPPQNGAAKPEPAKPEPARPAKPAPPKPEPAKPAPLPPLNTDRPASLLPGLGHLHHAITTRVPEAQSFFDQGFLLGFASNEEEAVRSFQRAAALDSQCPMALWGVAWALGPGIDRPRDAARDAQAREAIARAAAVSKAATDLERGYVEALSRRFSADPKADPAVLDAAYRDAMRGLAVTWPDDADAALLYAESLMALRPWREWWSNGEPCPEIQQAIQVLEPLLRRVPDHPGANRDYVLALESSPWPERALASARRLETLVPLAGGLLRAPARIDLRLGDYAAASATSEKAIEADGALMRDFGRTPLYPLLRAPRAQQTLAASRTLEGRGADAARAAQAARDGVADALALKDPPADLLPMLETRWTAPLFVALRFQKWDEILKDPEPDARLQASVALRHAARVVACAAKRDWACADAAKAAFETAREAVPAEARYGVNRTHEVLNIAGFVADARLQEARGRKDDALASWRSAVQAQDALARDTPSGWYDPLRESLGGALLRSARAGEAEKTFREDLDRHPRNGRSLFGLWKSLDAQKKTEAAALVKAQFDAAWRNADVTLKVEDL